ncbi:MAG TPA: PDZ domain-containing protein [Bryobacteraceae bacterium]|nr:PDZ domain-containing protein [Bryobacteraceae bacterium]
MNWLIMTAIVATAAEIAAAQTGDMVRYVVRFPDPQTHYVSVEANLPVAGKSEVEVFMPVWTPGSYLVREYARNIEAISVTGPGGKPLDFEKSRKNRWRVETGGAAEIRFSYRVYCREMSVRTNWVEDSFALLNGAPTFVTLVGGLARPHDIRLELPAKWKTTMTGLPEAPDGKPHHYLAPDYDTLVDSPILAGNPAVHKFEVDGIPHFLVNEGEAGVWDGPRSAADAEKLVRENRQMWGALPYRKYVFLNLLTEAGGGLEHRNSICIMSSRWATRTRAGYLGWLDLVSHEYFHAWNIKRLRPVELGPFDYENENPTRSLWVAEGITDYYAPLALRRAGLSSTQEFLGTDDPPARGSVSATIATLQSTPGRLVQSAEQASYDAWIKYYRPDENSVNTSISYYTKGAVVGWLLDARIRHATNGAKSLDDLMRVAFDKFSGNRGFTPDQFKATAEKVAGVPLSDFFRRTVESTEELDYTEALDWFGLRFKQEARSAGKNANGPKAWLGAETRTDNGRLIVRRVPRETPVYESGLSVDDEILAIDDFRVRPDQLSQRLENYKPGDKVSILVARRDQLMRIPLTLGEEPKKWQLEIRPDANEAQKHNLDAWIANQHGNP